MDSIFREGDEQELLEIFLHRMFTDSEFQLLTTEEVGQYFLLFLQMLENREPVLRDDDTYLSRVARLDTGKTLSENVRRMFNHEEIDTGNGQAMVLRDPYLARLIRK